MKVKHVQLGSGDVSNLPPTNRSAPFLLNGASRVPSIIDHILCRMSIRFRRKRFANLHKFLVGINSIIDFGGTPAIWESIGRTSNIALLNLDEQPCPQGFRPVKGDGRKTHFPDSSFDLAFSNSVIEHVGTWEDQVSFAREMQRVGKRIYCQTPARWFFFEPHYFTPFVHWFPFLLRRYWFVRYFTWYGLKWKPTFGEVKDFQCHLRLLTSREMRQLFPNCIIRREKFLGMTKSFIATSYSEPGQR